jgi:hypothetical protein
VLSLQADFRRSDCCYAVSMPGCRANSLRQFELVDLDLIVARFQSVQYLSTVLNRLLLHLASPIALTFATHNTLSSRFPVAPTSGFAYISTHLSPRNSLTQTTTTIHQNNKRAITIHHHVTRKTERPEGHAARACVYDSKFAPVGIRLQLTC